MPVFAGQADTVPFQRQKRIGKNPRLARDDERVLRHCRHQAGHQPDFPQGNQVCDFGFHMKLNDMISIAFAG